jgi:hypothetical protein
MLSKVSLRVFRPLGNVCRGYLVEDVLDDDPLVVVADGFRLVVHEPGLLRPKYFLEVARAAWEANW